MRTVGIKYPLNYLFSFDIKMVFFMWRSIKLIAFYRRKIKTSTGVVECSLIDQLHTKMKDNSSIIGRKFSSSCL